jgi:hypothetical protein
MLDRDGPELGAGRSYEPNQVFGRTSKSNKTSMTNRPNKSFAPAPRFRFRRRISIRLPHQSPRSDSPG